MSSAYHRRGDLGPGVLLGLVSLSGMGSGTGAWWLAPSAVVKVCLPVSPPGLLPAWERLMILLFMITALYD